MRSFKNAPRTLDLDILYFSGRNRNDARLTLPHSCASERFSVILPLGIMKMV
ncbi:MAG: 2-amino-4-hydroxy-6-hydroxymethyldihydropteridine diphosphokinase [Campylobacter sp.]|nr:2-amino-4-hydroxy-6-hydroxymethyldihydropteridine diphosphokinase [Campylobacter sp.]